MYYLFFYAQFFHEWWVVKIVFYMLVLLLLYSFLNFDIFTSFKTSLIKWLSVRLQSKRLGVPISMLSIKLKIWRLLQARSSLTFRQNIECGFTLKVIRDMIIAYNQDVSTQLRPSTIIAVKISLHFLRIRFLNGGTVFLVTVDTIFCYNIFFFWNKTEYKTNTIQVYNCYSWFNSWLLLLLILCSCYLLFLIVILVILECICYSWFNVGIYLQAQISQI